MILNEDFYQSVFQEKFKQIPSIHITFSYPNWAVLNLKTIQIISEGVCTHFFHVNIEGNLVKFGSRLSQEQS